jgi:Carboxypeptidase regulatory-like domain
VDGATSQPLAGVRVAIEGSAFHTMTDARGYFILDNVPPSAVLLTAEKPGYAAARIDGFRLPGNNGLPVTLIAGQKLQGTIRLYPAATVVGQVLNRSGRGLQGVTVFAFRYAYNDLGAETVREFARGRTNDLGEFRLTDLDPGFYRFRYEARPLTYGRPGEVPDLPTVYYPGVVSRAAAEDVQIERGVETVLRPVTIAPLPGRFIRFRVNPSDPRTATGAMFTLSVPGEFAPPIESGAILPGDNRAVGPIPPGRYELTVTAAGTGARARLAVELGVSDVQLEVPLLAEGSVTGQAIIVQTNDPGEQGARAVRGLDLTLVDSDGERRSTQSDERGVFGLSGIPGSQYRVEASAMPAETYLRMVISQERDVIRDGFFVDGDEVELSVVLEGAAGRIEGTVADEAGRPVPFGVVALLPEDRRNTHLFRETRTTADGTFSLSNLTPGGYQLFAWRELDGAAYRNGQFMESFQRLGHAVNLVPGMNLEVEISVLEQ